MLVILDLLKILGENYFFFYKRKKIYIVSILNHLKVPKKKFSKLSFIEKVNDNKFNLKIEKKIVQVLTK